VNTRPQYTALTQVQADAPVTADDEFAAAGMRIRQDRVPSSHPEAIAQ